MHAYGRYTPGKIRNEGITLKFPQILEIPVAFAKIVHEHRNVAGSGIRRSFHEFNTLYLLEIVLNRIFLMRNRVRVKK